MTTHHITIDQGATYVLPMTLARDGLPIDLTSATLRGQVRASHAAEVVAATFAAAIPNALAGQAVLSLTAVETAAIPAGVYVYDIELVEGAAVTRLIGGRATVSPEVTRT